MLQKFSLLTLNWNCLKASMKGMLSMSPTVPPNCRQIQKARDNQSKALELVCIKKMPAMRHVQRYKEDITSSSLRYVHNDCWYCIRKFEISAALTFTLLGSNANLRATVWETDLYDTNLRFHIVVINRDFGLLHNPLLNGICNMWHYWKGKGGRGVFILGIIHDGLYFNGTRALCRLLLVHYILQIYLSLTLHKHLLFWTTFLQSIWRPSVILLYDFEAVQ